MKFYLHEKNLLQWCSGILLHVAISAKSLQCTDFDTHNGWIELWFDNLSFRFTGKDKNCCKHITIDMHYYERKKHLLITLPVCLAHSCPTPQVRLLVGPKTGNTAKSTQFTSQSGVCSMQYKYVGFIFINSQKPDYRNKKMQLYSSIISLPSHTQSLHSIAVSLHKFLE